MDRVDVADEHLARQPLPDEAPDDDDWAAFGRWVKAGRPRDSDGKPVDVPDDAHECAHLDAGPNISRTVHPGPAPVDAGAGAPTADLTPEGEAALVERSHLRQATDDALTYAPAEAARQHAKRQRGYVVVDNLSAAEKAQALSRVDEAHTVGLKLAGKREHHSAVISALSARYETSAIDQGHDHREGFLDALETVEAMWP